MNGTSPLADLISYLPYLVVAFFAYQIGKSNGQSEGHQSARNQADQNLQAEYNKIQEKLSEAQTTIKGYKQTVVEQQSQIAQLHAYIDKLENS
ncbi:MAG: hypothetical protein E6Q61_02970 [Nitrosomonas sp.]|nr:MAG: hypothetical protein E6Q61_02970 [Nitrosomonas sp.]